VVARGETFWWSLLSLFGRQVKRSKMSNTAAAVAATAKATKKRAGGAAKTKKQSDHPKYSEMVNAALTALKVCNFLVFQRGVL